MKQFWKGWKTMAGWYQWQNMGEIHHKFIKFYKRGKT
jgi:hypothetical protein